MALARADEALRALGALTTDGSGGGGGGVLSLPSSSSSSSSLTPLGRAMAFLPLSPRHARALLEVASAIKRGEARPGALAAALALAAVMSLESPFLHLDGGSGGGGSGGGSEGGEQARRAAERLSALRAAHARLRDESGDALSAVAALAEYEQAAARAVEEEEEKAKAKARKRGGSSPSAAAVAAAAAAAADRWCAANGLHAKNLREASSLRKQLGATLARLAPPSSGKKKAAADDDDGSSSPSSSPSPLLGLPAAALDPATLVEAPRPAAPPAPPASLCSRPWRQGGLTRSLAGSTRWRGSRPLRTIPRPRRRRRLSAGQCATSPRPPPPTAARAPRSSCTRAPRCAAGPPRPWCAFADLVATAKRTYMSGVTALDPRWLRPAPRGWSRSRGRVPRPSSSSSDTRGGLCRGRLRPRPRRGDALPRGDLRARRWPLPASRAEEPNPEARAAVFAEALLSGRALRSLAPLRPWLAAPPSSMRAGRSSGQRRVSAVLEALMREGGGDGGGGAAAVDASSAASLRFPSLVSRPPVSGEGDPLFLLLLWGVDSRGRGGRGRERAGGGAGGGGGVVAVERRRRWRRRLSPRRRRKTDEKEEKHLKKRNLEFFFNVQTPVHSFFKNFVLSVC